MRVFIKTDMNGFPETETDYNAWQGGFRKQRQITMPGRGSGNLASSRSSTQLKESCLVAHRTI